MSTFAENVRSEFVWRTTTLVLSVLLAGALVTIGLLVVSRKPLVMVTTPEGDAIAVRKGTLDAGAEATAREVIMEISNYSGGTIRDHVLAVADKFAPEFRVGFLRAIERAANEAEKTGEYRTYNIVSSDVVSTGSGSWLVRVSGTGVVGYAGKQGTAPFKLSYAIRVSLQGSRYVVTNISQTEEEGS